MKAHIATPEGINIRLDGTPVEVAAVLKDVKSSAPGKVDQKQKATASSKRAPGNQSIPDLIDSLKREGFFKTPRRIGDIRKRLAELGHSYPVTTLSKPLMKQARLRNLRRFEEKGVYVYAQ